MGNTLIVYYSYSGTTKKLAEDIHAVAGGDIFALICEKAYSFHYNTAAKEARSEIQRGYCPKLLYSLQSIDEYSTIFIGSPNWFKTFAPPVLSFLRGYHFANKQIIPFCTHGGGGFGKIEEDILKECPQALLLPGFAVGADYTLDDIKTWVTSLGILR